MKWLTKVILAALLINATFLDVIAWRVDAAFREERDIACTPAGSITATAANSVWFIPLEHPSFDLLKLSMGRDSSRITLHAYGCDVNGHKYRIWREAQ